MHIFVCTDWTGEQIVCNEGDLEWIDKSHLLELPTWEGDKIFLRLIDEHRPFFSLKLTYEFDTLKEAVLDGQPLDCFVPRNDAKRVSVIARRND